MKGKIVSFVSAVLFAVSLFVLPAAMAQTSGQTVAPETTTKAPAKKKVKHHKSTKAKTHKKRAHKSSKAKSKSKAPQSSTQEMPK